MNHLDNINNVLASPGCNPDSVDNEYALTSDEVRAIKTKQPSTNLESSSNGFVALASKSEDGGAQHD
jgi:hypothetical protein